VEVLRALVGCTATGKTAVGLSVAERVGAEIVSMDSMLVYRGLDLGTAKPGPEERARVPHHLLDVADPDERYDVQRYLRDVREALRGIEARGRLALFVGGTGFYLKALTHGVFEGPPVDRALREQLEARAAEEGREALHAALTALDPASAARLHPNDVRRVVRALEVLEQTGRPLSAWQREWKEREGRPRRIVGLACPIEELELRIAARTEAMLDAGWREEAAGVRARTGLGPSARQALGYAEVLAYADGEIDRAECARLVTLRTRQLARRQATWWRHFTEIEWIDAPRDEPDVTRAAEEAQRHLFG
jgi:tRNA dimethylallyltransferase